MTLYNTDYDAWLTRDPNDHSKEEYLKEKAIEGLMDQYDMNWDDAENYYEEVAKIAEEDHIAQLAEDLK